MSLSVTITGLMNAAVGFVGAVTDSTCPSISLRRGVQHTCHNKTGADSIQYESETIHCLHMVFTQT